MIQDFSIFIKKNKTQGKKRKWKFTRKEFQFLSRGQIAK